MACSNFTAKLASKRGFKMIIKLNGVSKSYKKRNSKELVKAVDNISFEVNQGEIIGLLGPNGAGKSTTIKMICGLIRPDSGKIYVNGINNQTQRQKALKHISAVLEGNRNLYWRLSVKENLEYFAGNRGKSRKDVRKDIAKLLEQFNLEQKANELVNNLSRGMQQKLAIAVAMLAQTELMLLDEPTLGLDVETSYEVRELLKEIAAQGRTIIISSHDMAVIQDLCSRTVIINNGQIVVDDKVSNLLQLFDTSAYSLKLGKALNDEQIQELRKSFSIIIIEENLMDLQVNLERDNDIYKLMDILKSNASPISSLDRTNINFEQVFRQIVNNQSKEPVNDLV